MTRIKCVGEQDFFDVFVPNFHHYFAEGAIHHNTGKSHEAAWIFLCEYLVFPEETCVLVSSTDIRGLRGRIWSEITNLWQQAKDRYPHLPGNLLDSKLSILTDALDEQEYEKRSRDYRKCIQAVPCIQDGRYVGLSKFLGWKQRRMRLIADEAQFMGPTFLSAFSNLNNNISFKACVLGNPDKEYDPLGKAAEPIEGWNAYRDVEKTTVWRTKFFNGVCVNLIGTDSPNFDFPEDQPDRYTYMVGRKKIGEVLATFGKDSYEYRSQAKGNMQISSLDRHVVTRELCKQGHAQDEVNWEGPERTKIAALDAAYGGDRCVLGHCEFGKEVGGKIVLKFFPPHSVPLKVDANTPVEEAIAIHVKEYCEAHGVKAENFYHDSTGRGSLGTALARVWSNQCNPVEYGGMPSERPVSLDIFTYDEKTHARRLKLAREHYANFVTELWYSMRYAIESAQIRCLPDDVMEELCLRLWEKIPGSGKIQVEPKTGSDNHLGMKQRVGRSPDLGDFAVTCLEGARRRGFQISKLANEEASTASVVWLRDLQAKARKLREAHDLNYSVA